MFTVKTQNKEFLVEKSDDSISVNGSPISWDLQWISPTKIHFLLQNKSLEAELISFERESKTIQIRFGNKISYLIIQDRHDLLLEKLGLNLSASNTLKEIKAPMPGLILDLKVKPGDEVKKGDVVLILEAMKMENSIKSPGDGIVKSVKVNLKDSVEKNQVLIQF
jgi:biotin carboxyl carrier protein